MKSAEVVIGANYGDEGKGLITDYLTSKYEKSLVVRFNGGAQAGHTVQSPAIGILPGKRHVFSHFGSGTLVGADTYLSKYFVANPIIFKKESVELYPINRKIYVDERCFVTTPYDIFINHILENSRNAKHGSCGLGFNETITRSLTGRNAIKLTVGNLFSTPNLIKILSKIRDEYVYERLNDLSIQGIPGKYYNYVTSKSVFENFIEDVIYFRNNIITCDESIINESEHVIFEGAQGLLLDEDYGNFPHVTRSRTGLKNVSKILDHTNIDTVSVYYVTRPYITRHGAGPLSHKSDTIKTEFDIHDPTNVPNEFQGSMQYGYLNIDLLESTILKDIRDNSQIGMCANLAITCLDQVKAFIKFKGNNADYSFHRKNFINIIGKLIAFRKILTSYGPTRDTIKSNSTCDFKY